MKLILDKCERHWRQ